MITVLKKRSDFLKARNSNIFKPQKYFFLQAFIERDVEKDVKENTKENAKENLKAIGVGNKEINIKFGLTVSKKVGCAVLRNKAKRRLREAVRPALTKHGKNNVNYVFIAKSNLVYCNWQELQEHISRAIESINNVVEKAYKL